MSLLSTKTVLTVEGPQSRSFHVSEVQEYYHRQFSKIGRLSTLNDKQSEPDLLELMASMSQGAQNLLVQIKQNLNPNTSIARLKATDLSKGQLNKRALYAKELIGLNVIRKVPANGIKDLEGNELYFPAVSYMISPHHFVPYDKVLGERIDHIWSQVL